MMMMIYIIFSTLVIATIFGQLQYNEILTFLTLSLQGKWNYLVRNIGVEKLTVAFNIE